MTYYTDVKASSLYTASQVQALSGLDPATTSVEVLNLAGWYPVILENPNYDNNLYVATATYTITPPNAYQSWVYTPVDLAQAKIAGKDEEKQKADLQVANIVFSNRLTGEVLSSVASQDPVDRPAPLQTVLDATVAVTDALGANLIAVDAATSVDEINNIVNKPTGILFTGRGSGLGPEDLNVSYYTEFNSVSMTESETELYVPGTATVIPYGSGGPGKFDSMGNAFNPGDYLIQIRETATSMVIAEFEVPLNPTGEDVAF